MNGKQINMRPIPMKLPGPRFGYGLALDKRRQQPVLFGGADPFQYSLKNDVWSLGRAGWEPITTHVDPPAGG